MGNINTAMRYVPGAKPKLVEDLTEEFARRDNAAFLAEVARRLSVLAESPGAGGARFDPGGVGCVGLIGEYGLIGYGIRRAEELIRVDHSPSHWSHAFLFATPLSKDAPVNRDPDRSPWLWESTLEPASAFNRFTDRNGVGPRRISDYALAEFDLLEPHSVPNIAVVAIALTEQERGKVMDRANDPDVDQLHYDISGLLGTWYAYLTNRAEQQNPLASGRAIFCSAFVQLAYDAVGIDLAPGAHQRNTSPEHIWQGVRYLGSTFRIPGESGRLVERPVRAWSCVRDEACLIAPIGPKARKLPQTLRTLTAAAEGTRSNRTVSSRRRTGRRSK